MRVSAAERARSQERIIAAASTLLRGGGASGASVHEVMKAAGLTHGGFYRHFPDKEAMLAAAIAAAFAEFAAHLESGDGNSLAAFERLYLSDDHVAHPALGCPAAAAAPDVTRAGPTVRAAFGAGLATIIDRMAAALTGRHRRQRAIRQFATMVGAVVLARASDPDTAAEVLAAVRAHRASPS